MSNLYETAKSIARDLIESEGPDPEYLSIVETADEVAEEKELDAEELAAEVERLVKAAVITIEFPGPEDA